ncbi:MAG: UDP-N-acetylmuramoyl-L-alanine--D-glutamate ligase [Oscillospiraceae bacterium]|nr:UDP-N-acetylmuramoyl-L-alanine--D-glutamate ligase [Oscillospiraceae bacterium]
MTLSDYLHTLCGKKVDVLGIGISNRPLIRLLLRSGIEVVARDKTPREKLGETADEFEKIGAKLVLGENYLKGIDGDVIFRSPGIRPDLPEIVAAVQNGSVLTSEMEAFFEVCPCDIIAITGSDGKTTTTTVTSEILKRDGKRVWVGGNIGTPLLDKAEEMSADDICVLELSSFQLMTLNKSPKIAVITNVAPNHLDVHKGMEEYVWAKKNIFDRALQPEKVVLNADNDITADFAKDAGHPVMFSRRGRVSEGVYLENGDICASFDGTTERIMSADSIFLPGVHNIENYMAAFAATWGITSKAAMVETARSFKGVEHRIEFVRELNGVKFYNDSIASSPSRTTAGLRSFKQKVILMAGGKDKGVPFDSLGAEIAEHVKTLVVTGWTAEKITEAAKNSGFTGEIIHEDDFCDAVRACYKAAESGDIVLMSPACTSFDRFKNFEERGKLFKKTVMELN